MTYVGWALYNTWLTSFLGALLCVLGFMSAVIVSALDKVGMKQLGLDGAIQEESRKVVRGLSDLFCLLFFFLSLFRTSFCVKVSTNICVSQNVRQIE